MKYENLIHAETYNSSCITVKTITSMASLVTTVSVTMQCILCDGEEGGLIVDS